MAAYWSWNAHSNDRILDTNALRIRGILESMFESYADWFTLQHRTVRRELARW